MSLRKFITSAGGGISIQYEDDVDFDSQNEYGPSLASYPGSLIESLGWVRG